MLGFEIFSYDLLARGRLVVGSAINGWRALGHLLLVVRPAARRAADAWRLPSPPSPWPRCGGLVAIIIVALRDLRGAAPATRAAPLRCRGDCRCPRSPSEVPDDLDRRPLWRLVTFNLRHGCARTDCRRSPISCCCVWTRACSNISAGAAEVGLYSLAVYVGELLWLLPGALTPAAGAQFGRATRPIPGATAPPPAPCAWGWG